MGTDHKEKLIRVLQILEETEKLVWNGNIISGLLLWMMKKHI